MNKIKKETFDSFYKPFDVVELKDGSVAYISEVSVSPHQSDPKHQVSYAISFLIQKGYNKVAWYDHDELKVHCNLFVKIAEGSACSMGSSEEWVKKLMF